ncbi:ABC transporter substrate-binding protein [Tuanshanicoccus lijuaniae]|uniref:ABC transporter substrate-binding protein n=1 Tax=Aerococcaceae bacterium zg-1292 TaxID=2774330 RepID=UPI001BD840A7|nr:ABC transporter substrate-binding protein [Aerococcaceae bacterium zg-BR22]MBS4455515.1 ABC transporter substrate-binding protein [Aerococcaceae bacterium zg-A91]MBS4457134.1 ABC transporter substrate-binding protein [Aerococcaceae bacterium zg-BR33]
MKKLDKVSRLVLFGLASLLSVQMPLIAAQETIKIAVAGPMTGDNSEYGIGFDNAVKMMAEKWNADGGIDGKKIDVLTYDDRNSPEEGVSVANKILSDNVSGVIGHFASGVSMAAAPTYNKNKVVEISPSASHPDYSDIGEYIFRNNTVIEKEARASLDIAVNNFKKKKIGIISIKTDWGVSTSSVVKKLVEKMGNGVEVVAHEEVIEGSDDYSPAIANLASAGTEVVIVVGMYNLVAPVSRQYKQINPNVKIVGFSNAYSSQLLELGGPAVEGVAFPVIFFAESEDKNIKSFVEEYEEKYGSKPSALTAQAYDSAGILFTAIKNVGSLDSELIKNEIYKLEYDGVAGFTKFDEKGDVEKTFTKVVVKDGAFKLLKE